MDEEMMSKVREAIDNFLPRPDLDALIDSGDLIKVIGGYQAPTEKGRKAIEKYTVGITISNQGKPSGLSAEYPAEAKVHNLTHHFLLQCTQSRVHWPGAAYLLPSGLNPALDQLISRYNIVHKAILSFLNN